MNLNEQRLMNLIDEIFDTKNDPTQLNVNEEIIKQLLQINTFTLGEERIEAGPIAWTLVIPTTTEIMEQFIYETISENDLFYKSIKEQKYTSLYLCSAIVLPEYRRKGIAKRLLVQSVLMIIREHPIKSLVAWPFNSSGLHLSLSVAKECNLPLYIRKNKRLPNQKTD